MNDFHLSREQVRELDRQSLGVAANPTPVTGS